ncbi:Glycosyl hydrolases family 38 C-terminal domain-containing protein [Tangfeifania diversioriginum]|uniref:Glycosyl hydrolases family 38 C-terminal domain-containing protein n=1 Tax=Tangfeifania diversioriginum TaxID=1168035 RepID=A0A1M6E385_9BACT|nr:glycoside hydrolase family 38 C-terminal domain-containing protein [Tangfeifania diversioriginum]SHI79956.1 Glycosyl hydrolases family 38 C-terminal domain-containing protein [Tangfeifania diversioriginum]
MKNYSYRLSILFFLFLGTNIIAVGQEEAEQNAKFYNVSALLKENGKSYQQVIANYNASKEGIIQISHNNEILLRDSLNKGNNQFQLTFPAIKKAKDITLTLQVDNFTSEKIPFTIVPPKKWEVNIVQHSHTDIGYTRPQSEILAEHMRFIDYALDYCDQTDALPDAAKFRWTCESAWVTQEYLRTRPAAQIKRLLKRIEEGRIEVTAMLFNMAEIADENIMVDFLTPLKLFNKYEIPVYTAMQNDVNGIAWSMPDYFKNTGVKYLNMGINETRSIRPFDKPTCFWWESPAGERLLAYRSDHYMTGNFWGMPSKEDFNEIKLLNYLKEMENKDFPFDKIQVQFSGYRTDNAPPSTGACEIIEAWNKKYEYPKLKLAITKDFFEYIEKNHADELPVYQNAWLDWWSDGFGSSARETAEVRKTQNLKQVDEGIFAMVQMLGGEVNKKVQDDIWHISENALFYDEHTYGAAESISQPFSINSMRQWLQKGAYSWEAMKQVTLLHEDALGRLQQFFKKADFPVIYVVNSMGWNRSATIQLFIDYEILPSDKAFSIIDLTTNEKIPVQFSHGRREGSYWNLEVGNVPALGFKALKIDVSEEKKQVTELSKNENTEVLENQYFKIAIDKKTGGIKEFYDKELQENLYDNENPYFIGQPVRETLESRNKMAPSHSTVFNLKVEPGVAGDVWKSIKVAADLKGFTEGEDGEPQGIEWEIRLFNNSKKVEFSYQASKEIITDPEALYVAFPFRLPDSRITFETIGGSLAQGEQLPGSSSDWNVAQNFVSVKGSTGQIIMVSDEVPLWHFSDFNMGKFERYPKPGKPWLYSWVMNNYWFTNFRAFQEGTVNWTYTISTTTDTTVTTATKFAWGVRNPLPTRTFPAGKNELTSPVFKTMNITGDENVMLINSRPSFNGNGSVLLHFREIDGKPAQIGLSSQIEDRPVKTLKQVNIIGEIIQELDVKNIAFNPNEVKFIEIEL